MRFAFALLTLFVAPVLAQTFEVTLSGGLSPTNLIGVDDDLTVYLNGTAIFVDNDGRDQSLNTGRGHAPLRFVAKNGDVIRVVATNTQFPNEDISPLYLHSATNAIQVLDATGIPQRPSVRTGVFYDRQFTVSLFATEVSSRTFLVTFTGFNNEPSTCTRTELNLPAAGDGCFRYPENEITAGMATLAAHARVNASLRSVVPMAFTYFTRRNDNRGKRIAPPDSRDHEEAERWLMETQNFDKSRDRLIVAGHSWGGNRARLFANQMWANRQVRTEKLILVDPIDWEDCSLRRVEGSSQIDEIDVEFNLRCYQHRYGSYRFSITPASDTFVYRQIIDLILTGYTVPGANDQVMTLKHAEIDDAELVHRRTLNLIQQVYSNPPPFAVQLFLTNEAATPTPDFVQVPLAIKNIGPFLANNMSVSATLTMYSLPVYTTTINRTISTNLCSATLLSSPLGFACPSTDSTTVLLQFAIPRFGWSSTNTATIRVELISNGVFFLKTLRIK
jgi:pimeloyl-ACP methyl ester carboxylesterase